MISKAIVTKKEIFWLHGPFSENFRNMSTIEAWSFTEGKDFFFEELQAVDGIGAVLAFLDNNMLIAIATAKRFRD